MALLSNRVLIAAVWFDSKHCLRMNVFRTCEKRLFVSVIKHLSEMMMMNNNSPKSNQTKEKGNTNAKHKHKRMKCDVRD